MEIFVIILTVICVLSSLLSLAYILYSALKFKVLHVCVTLIVFSFFGYWSLINLAWLAVLFEWGI